MDFRAGNGQTPARTHSRDRPVGHPVLSVGRRLAGRHPFPVDHERLLADGCDRMRHRPAPASPGRRQHPRRRDADVPQAVGPHPDQNAEDKGTARRKDSTRSSCHRNYSSYDLNEQGLFNVEYADGLGIPFDFTAKPLSPARLSAPARPRPSSIPTTPPTRPDTSASTPRRPTGTRPMAHRRNATSTGSFGSFSTATGKPNSAG